VETANKLINKLDSPINRQLIAAKGLEYMVERFKQRARGEIGELKLESYRLNIDAFR
jgi:hypothetical protein